MEFKVGDEVYFKSEEELNAEGNSLDLHLEEWTMSDKFHYENIGRKFIITNIHNVGSSFVKYKYKLKIDIDDNSRFSFWSWRFKKKASFIEIKNNLFEI